jgi:hypothetical protein
MALVGKERNLTLDSGRIEDGRVRDGQYVMILAMWRVTSPALVSFHQISSSISASERRNFVSFGELLFHEQFHSLGVFYQRS